jgi:valyl-tRNA synthetase
MIDIPKAYDPKPVEEKWYRFWLDRGYFHAEERSDKKPFCIVIPPPNVTGSLHIGHALDNTLQDILIRWRRMQGYNTLWLPGTDHAGIITQHVMERMLAQEGLSRQQIGREKFLERMWRWKEESRGTIIGQLMKLGCSCDWERERFTLDEGLSRAVRTAFKRLYDDGLIYRGSYIVNWCPRCETALSDLEVEYVETQGKLYYVKYPLADGDGELVIATTRPETMLGDTGVAVNPEDERYKNLIGSKAILPVVGRELPIVGDPVVDMEFGTGVLKVTPAHDPTDFEIGKRHNLPELNVMNLDGTMNQNAAQFAGMDRYECRDALVNVLRERGYLVKVEDYIHAVQVCERCHTPIEPLISEQWFVRTQPLARKAIGAAREKRVRFVPEMWEKEFYNWMNNIRDWCISRQIWWGHRIPVWTCESCGAEIVEVETPQSCPKCGSGDLRQDPDVLDTWFSSALWPFSTLGWPDDTQLLQQFYPTSVLITGWDILFFWVSRMIMMGLKLMGEVPFRYVYLHPLVADEMGRKMSKSRGNVIDPLDSMEKYGTDAFRFALTTSVIPSRYMPLPESRMEGGRNFTNKIWNASRFVIMNLSDFKPGTSKDLRLELCDRWILSRYNRLVASVNQALEGFKFEVAAQIIYDFMWHEFCDWYVELSKIRLYHVEEPERRYTAQFVLWRVLEGIMRLMHPIMPFITEEIWQMLPHDGESVAVAPYPDPDENELDEDAERRMDLLMSVIRDIRNIRSEMNIPPSKELKVILQAPQDWEREVLEGHRDYISFLCRAPRITVSASAARPPASAAAVVGDIEIFVPLADLIDLDRERARLRKELERTIRDLEKVERNLKNESFLTKAPPHIVERERERKAELESAIAKLEKNLSFLEDA